MRCNDNAFVFNIMLGYNTAFYDIPNENWYWDESNPRATTCYIKFGESHFEYTQPVHPDNHDINVINDNEILIQKAKVIS